MKNELLTRHVAGATAILSGVAQVSWAVLNGVTQGGLDSGGASTLAVRIGQILLISWNLLLLPVALFLGTWLKSKSPYIVVGIAALLDGMITLFTLPPPLFYGGALKLHFSLIWDFWIGIMLLIPVNRKVSHLQRGSTTNGS